MTEKWMPIPRHLGYEASDQGRIRSIDRVIETRTGPQRRRGRVLRGNDDMHGYLTVHLPRRRVRIGVLVLETFVGPRPPGADCCHDDDVKRNNTLPNLRWDTRSANALDRVRNGGHTLANRTDCVRGHALSGPNLIFKKNGRWRRCLACKRAWSYASLLKRRGAIVDPVELSHAYYDELMGRAA